VLYELPHFDHVDAASVEEAVGWLTDYGARAKLLAGGTDLLGLMKDRIEGPRMRMPELLVNVKTIPELRQTVHTPGRELTIGAATTLGELERHPMARARFTALAQAAASVATPQIREVGTIGGNLCQRPWCWYFRHPQFVCFKRGGRQCYAIPGHHKSYFSILNLGICVMSHPSDTAPALVALGAEVAAIGPGGERRIPAEAFFEGPRSVPETVLAANEMVARVVVPEARPGTRSAFFKSRPRNTWDFALSAVAVSMTCVGPRCEAVRLVLGGVAPAPYRVRVVEEILVGQTVDERRIGEAAHAAMESARPLRMNGYKVDLTRALIRRALAAVAN
jgi:xanthine dehydrogenase YagS FAD-binding subunit